VNVAAVHGAACLPAVGKCCKNKCSVRGGTASMFFLIVSTTYDIDGKFLSACNNSIFSRFSEYLYQPTVN